MITARGHATCSRGTAAAGRRSKALPHSPSTTTPRNTSGTATTAAATRRNNVTRAIGFRFGDDDEEDDTSRIPSKVEDDDEADLAAGLATLSHRGSSPGAAAASPSDGRALPPIVPRLSQSSNLRAQSLLVLAPVLRAGPVGEAFSSLLATATRYQAKNSEIAREFSRLYAAMLASGQPSWPDYLVDQVLAGRDNPLARAAAQGQLDFDDAPALQALRADLDALQELAAPLKQIAAYVGDVAPTVPARWVAAAGSEPSARRPGASTAGMAGAAGAQAGGGGADGAGGAAAALTTIDVSARSRFVRPPPTEAELGAWRAAVQGHARWSQAVPLLQAFWHLHGFGVTSRASALRWSAGGLEEVPGAAGGAAAAIAAAAAATTTGGGAGTTATTTSSSSSSGGGGGSLLAAMDALSLSSHAAQRAAVERNLARHAAGLVDAPARPLLLAGPPGSGKTWLLREGALRSAAVRSGGVRVVDVGPAELNNLLEAARGCGRYPRVRFVLLADDVPLPLGGGGGAWASELLAALASAGGGAAAGAAGSAAWWPANVTLHVAASASSAVGWGDPLAQRCGEVVLLPAAGEEGFLSTLRELLAAAAAAAAGEEQQDGGGGFDEARALAWAKERGALSLRGAAAYARELVAEAAFARAVEEGRVVGG